MEIIIYSLSICRITSRSSLFIFILSIYLCIVTIYRVIHDKNERNIAWSICVILRVEEPLEISTNFATKVYL